MSWFNRLHAWLNTALFAAPLALVLWFGGIPARLSTTDIILISPVNCPHGISCFVVQPRDPKGTCHDIKPEPEHTPPCRPQY